MAGVGKPAGQGRAAHLPSARVPIRAHLLRQGAVPAGPMRMPVVCTCLMHARCAWASCVQQRVLHERKPGPRMGGGAVKSVREWVSHHPAQAIGFWRRVECMGCLRAAACEGGPQAYRSCTHHSECQRFQCHHRPAPAAPSAPCAEGRGFDARVQK